MSVFIDSSRSRLRPVAAALILSALYAGAAYGQLSPALQGSTVNLGRKAPSEVINGTVWLQLHDKAALDAAVKDMYTPGSARYHNFAEPEALRQFAPTADEMASVKKELAAHNLRIISADAQNFAVKVEGMTSDFEAAFHTTVNQHRAVTGEVVSSLTSAPTLSGGAAGMLHAVTGLGTPKMKPYIQRPVDPQTGKAIGRVPLANVLKPAGAYFSSNCFYAPQPRMFTDSTNKVDAAYYGVVYGASVGNTTPGTVSPCGYSPQDVYGFYGLQTAYNQGYTGKGQTIVIVDAYGSPTIKADLDAFNQLYKLPVADDTNFRVLTPAPVTNADAGWAGETTLDVEWAHAIAPGANIVLIPAPSPSNDDLQAAVLYAVENRLGNVISNSYGLGELQADPQSVTSWDEVCEMAAFVGISANFATGDSGDFAAEEKGQVDVSTPADSPYATAVGGTTTTYSLIDGSLVQFGWGTNITRLTTKTTIDDPPFQFGFQFGSGGGTSQYFKKPAYQKALNGKGRLLPDVSALADPYTPGEFVFTDSDGIQYVESVGGTSLATPIFSAEWALLDQRFGFSLGQAAPLIALVGNTGAISDVAPLPAVTQYDVRGAIADSNGFTNFSVNGLIAPETDVPFLSAFYVGTVSGSTYDLSFGTDSSLPVTKGWDAVTGFGSLNMGAIFSALGK